MDIKDDVVRLYVKRFIIPRALIFDRPGFVDFKISGKTNIFARQLLVPESFFVELERKIVETFGEKGKAVLYSIGKKFGYRFSMLGRFENIKDHPGESVKNWVVVASKFVEGTYASRISQDIDVANKIVNYSLTNFAVCRKLGFDFFLAMGGAAGIIAWIFQDPTIEGYLYDSKFVDGNHLCKVKCALPETLEEDFGAEIYRETDLNGLEPDRRSYLQFNAEVDLQYKKSFQNLLDAGIFSYKKGIIKYKDERFFLMEVSGLYLLEMGLQSNKMEELISNVAFFVGENLFAEFSKDKIYNILELLCALGWGEPLLVTGSKKIKVVVKHFPWAEWYSKIEFRVVGGLLSGIFSKVYERKILFGKPSFDLNSGNLTLLFEEK
jgi:hypothetical protein